MLKRSLSPSPIARGAVVSLAYLVIWVGLDLLARAYAVQGAVIPWYPGVAVLFYLFYTFGARYWFLPILAEVIRATVFPQTNHMSPLAYMGFGAIQSISYIIVAYVLRDRLRVNLPFVGFRDASNFCSTMMVASALISVPIVGLGIVLGRIPLDQFWNQAITYWIGDGVALVVFVPFIAMYATPLLARWMVSPSARDDRVPVSPGERLVLWATLIAALGLGWATVRYNVTADPILYFTFLPLVLIASRGGLRLAVPAVFVAETVTTAFSFTMPATRLAPLEFQSYLAISALAALAVGALVTQYHRRERRSRLLLFSDHLTGLPNRNAMESWVAEATIPITLATFDFDRKLLTTSGISRSAMDGLMVAIAQRVQLLDAMFTARVESDEFACAFDGTIHDADIVKTIFAMFDEPFAVGESEIFISISLGLSHATRDGERDNLLRDAGLAMYRAKRNGRGGYVVATPDIAAHEGDASLIGDLHRAHRDQEFTLFYQPIVRLNSGESQCIGVEALLRWEHPTLGLLEPAAFLETLESLRLADRVGRWVIDETCRQLQRWSERGIHLQGWINLFPRQAVDVNLANTVEVAAADSRIAPSSIVVEILEGVVAENNAQLVENVRALHDIGARVAIDDFGTGHSSLARLREIPADIMKIDRSFITRSEADPKARGVIHAVLQMAEELHFVPLAEGVENEAQLNLLRGQGCELVQGYHIGRPMRADDLENWIASLQLSTTN